MRENPKRVTIPFRKNRDAGPGYQYGEEILHRLFLLSLWAFVLNTENMYLIRPDKGIVKTVQYKHILFFNRISSN